MNNACRILKIFLPTLMLTGAFAIPSMTTQPAATTQAADRAVIIPIRDEITEITLDSIKRRLKYVREEHIPLVILEFDTPGGALQPTLKICHAIKGLRNEGIRTYAWI